MPTAVLKADVVLDAVLDANCCPNNSQKMLDTKIMCCVLQQPHTHQPTQKLIHQYCIQTCSVSNSSCVFLTHCLSD